MNEYIRWDELETSTCHSHGNVIPSESQTAGPYFVVMANWSLPPFLSFFFFLFFYFCPDHAICTHIVSLKQRRIPEGDAATDAEHEVVLQPVEKYSVTFCCATIEVTSWCSKSIPRKSTFDKWAKTYFL